VTLPPRCPTNDPDNSGFPQLPTISGGLPRADSRDSAWWDTADRASASVAGVRWDGYPQSSWGAVPVDRLPQVAPTRPGAHNLNGPHSFGDRRRLVPIHAPSICRGFGRLRLYGGGELDGVRLYDSILHRPKRDPGIEAGHRRPRARPSESASGLHTPLAQVCLYTYGEPDAYGSLVIRGTSGASRYASTLSLIASLAARAASNFSKRPGTSREPWITRACRQSRPSRRFCRPEQTRERGNACRSTSRPDDILGSSRPTPRLGAGRSSALNTSSRNAPPRVGWRDGSESAEIRVCLRTPRSLIRECASGPPDSPRSTKTIPCPSPMRFAGRIPHPARAIRPQVRHDRRATPSDGSRGKSTHGAPARSPSGGGAIRPHTAHWRSTSSPEVVVWR